MKRISLITECKCWRVCVNLQHISRPKSEQVVVDSGQSSTQCSTNLPDFGLAPSGERLELSQTSTGRGWMHVTWESSGEVASLGQACSTGARVAREVQNRWKSLQLSNSTWKCDEEWAIPKFWQRSHRSPHKFTDSSPNLPVFLVTRATLPNLSKCDWGIILNSIHSCSLSSSIYWTLCCQTSHHVT